MGSEDEYEQFEAEIHASEHFGKTIAYKAIALSLGVSVLGFLLYQVGPNMHSRYGRYMWLASIAMMLGGVVVAFILRHDYLYKETGEKLKNWYRYFDHDQRAALVSAFEDENWPDLKSLRFALDENETDNSDASGTSALLIDVHGVGSGDYLAVQVVEYVRSRPVGITPLKVIRGDAGKKVVEHFIQVNQGK